MSMSLYFSYLGRNQINKLMKKLTFIAVAALAFCLSSNDLSAQGGFSIELDLGYNLPGGDFSDNYDGGVGVAIHPRMKIGDQMAAGLSIGANGFAGVDSSGGTGGAGSVSAAGVTTVMGTFQYKLFDKKVTPYAELGVGLWSGEVLTGDVASQSAEKVSNFGFAPEVGVMIGFLNASAAYTVAGDFNYIQVGLGFRFGSK